MDPCILMTFIQMNHASRLCGLMEYGFLSSSFTCVKLYPVPGEMIQQRLVHYIHTILGLLPRFLLVVSFPLTPPPPAIHKHTWKEERHVLDENFVRLGDTLIPCIHHFFLRQTRHRMQYPEESWTLERVPWGQGEFSTRQPLPWPRAAHIPSIYVEFPAQKWPNVKKRSLEIRFARRLSARLPYPTLTGWHQVCITRQDDPALRLPTNRGWENHLFVPSVPPLRITSITRNTGLGKLLG